MIITVAYRGNGEAPHARRVFTFDHAAYGERTYAEAARCMREIERSDTLALIGRPTVSAICDYCDQPAVKITRDGGEPLCGKCGRDQYDSPAESLAWLTFTTFRMYAAQSV
jgi:hypothetical protein